VIQLNLSAVISVVVSVKCEDLSWPVCSMSHNSFCKHWTSIIFVMNVVCDRLLQKPFLVNAQIRVQEDHLNASLASPLFSRSLKKMFPRKPSTLNVQFEDGNLRFSSSDHLSTGYGQAEFPITLRIDVEKGGEILSVDSVSGTSIQKTFKVGPEVRITEFRVDDSWMQLRGDFLITP
jgi:hypothetical protein